MARRTWPDLGGRRRHLPGLDPHRLHRVHLPAELRCTVDCGAGKGCSELRRRWRVLQRAQFRPDVWIPHGDPPLARRRSDGRPSAPGPHAGRGQALSAQRAHGGGTVMMARKKEYYAGVRMAPYDLLKEALVALGVVTVLVVLLSAVLSSPDEKPLTLQSVATTSPDVYTLT